MHTCLKMINKLFHLLVGHLGSVPLDSGGSSQSQLWVVAEVGDSKSVGKCVAHPNMGGQGQFIFGTIPLDPEKKLEYYTLWVGILSWN